MFAQTLSPFDAPQRWIGRFATSAAALSAVCVLAINAATPAFAQDEDSDDSASAEDVKTAYVRMETTKGDIYLELNAEKAPISVENFLQYVEDEFYDGTIFHRVIPNFMIQGGGFTDRMVEKATRAPIKNEWENGLKNVRGSIAMARLGNRADSATSQFFINVRDNAALDQPRDGSAYAVFGKVIAGMSVVDAIRVVPTHTARGHQNVPVEPVIIRKVRRISAEEAKKAVDAEKADNSESEDDGDAGGSGGGDGGSTDG